MILLFGAGGQLGLEMVSASREQGVGLTALAHSQADIADEVAVRQAVEALAPRLVVNAAAYNDVDAAETQKEAAERANLLGPSVLARICAERGIPIVHISSDYVFGGLKEGSYNEDDPLEPLGVYGMSKAQGEEAVRRLQPRHLILRTAWLFSVHRRNFLKTMIRLAAEREEIDVVADQRGSPTSAADLARAILALGPRLTEDFVSWGTYHFAGQGDASRFEFAERIIGAQQAFTAHRPVLIPIKAKDFPTPARRPANSSLDSSRFSAKFGISARPWQQAVDRTVRALLAP